MSKRPDVQSPVFPVFLEGTLARNILTELRLRIKESKKLMLRISLEFHRRETLTE